MTAEDRPGRRGRLQTRRAPAHRRGQPGLGWAGTAAQERAAREPQRSRDGTGEQLGLIEAAGPAARRGGRRPRHHDRSGIRLQQRHGRIDEMRREPRHDAAGAAVLHARHELARHALVCERRRPRVDDPRWRGCRSGAQGSCACRAHGRAGPTASGTREREDSGQHGSNHRHGMSVRLRATVLLSAWVRHAAKVKVRCDIDGRRQGIRACRRCDRRHARGGGGTRARSRPRRGRRPRRQDGVARRWTCS